MQIDGLTIPFTVLYCAMERVLVNRRIMYQLQNNPLF
jgi:hypothetical protein